MYSITIPSSPGALLIFISNIDCSISHSINGGTSSSSSFSSIFILLTVSSFSLLSRDDSLRSRGDSFSVYDGFWRSSLADTWRALPGSASRRVSRRILQTAFCRACHSVFVLLQVNTSRSYYKVQSYCASKLERGTLGL
jgi:hypothetical protein